MRAPLKNLIAPTIAIILLAFVGGMHEVRADFNSQINYQGKLTNASNVAVADGTYNMQFWLVASSTAATSTAVWSESHTGADRVQVTSGLFSVMLGSVDSLAGVDFNQTLYLSVEIGGTGGTPTWDGEMSPRKVLGTVPAAFVADTLDGFNSTQFVRTDATSTIATSSADTLLTITQNGAGDIVNIFDGSTEVFTILDGGNIGIGSSTPSVKLTVGGDAYVGGNLTATGTLSVTGHSTLTTASTTNLTVSGNSYLGTVTSGTWNGSTVSVAYGGTGATTLTGLLIGNGTSPFTATTTLSSSYIEDVFLRNDGDTATGDYTFDTSTLFIDSTNNRVGVGTTTPSFALDAQSGVSGEWAARIYNTHATNGYGLQIRAGDDANVKALEVRNVSAGALFTILGDGNVGIGTTTPSAMLTVGATSSSQFLVSSLGVITDGTWNADTITEVYGGTGQTTYATGDILYASGANALAKRTIGNTGDVLLVSGGVPTWAATSTLGLGNGTFLGLSDTPDAYTAGSVLFTSGSAVTEDNAQFYWDNTSKRLAIGHNSFTGIPTGTDLAVISTTTATARLSIANTNGTDVTAIFDARNDGSVSAVQFGATSNHPLYFYTNNTEQMTLSAAGNLGIGTTTPSAKLDLYGTAGSDDIFAISSSTNARLLTVTAAGKVGIGTTTPGSLLTVEGSAASAAQFGRTVDGGGWITLTRAGAIRGYLGYEGTTGGSLGTGTLGDSMVLRSQGALHLIANAGGPTNGITISTAGNVGIGTTTPAYALDVTGEIRATSNIRADDKIITSRYGVAGTYLSTQVQGVWSIGDAYQIDTTANDFGSQYGIVYAHTNASSTGTTKGPISGWGHQILFTSNGARNAAISLTNGHAYFAGNVGIGTTSPNAKLHVTNTGSDYSFFVEDSTSPDTSPFIIDASGNVGIGTESPAAKLDVVGTSTLALRLRGVDDVNQIADMYVGAFGQLVLATGNGSSSSAYVDIRPEDDQYGLIVRDGSGASTAFTNFYHNNATVDYLNIVVNSANSVTGLVVDDNNNVGIGITDPAAPLSFGPAIGAKINLYGTSYAIGVESSELRIASNAATTFYTGGYSGTEVLHIDASGHTYPGANNTQNLGSTSFRWSCLYYDATNLGTCSSDERLKHDIKDLTFGEDPRKQLAEMKLRTFVYNDDTSSTVSHGFVAQELLAVAPDLVELGDDGFYKVRYGDLPYFTIAALQQLDGDLTDLLIYGTTTASSTFASLFDAETDTIWSRIVTLAQNFVDGVLTVAGLKADEVTANVLCLGETCVTEDELKALLNGSGAQQSRSGVSDTPSDGELTPASTTDTEPEPDPEVPPTEQGSNTEPDQETPSTNVSSEGEESPSEAGNDTSASEGGGEAAQPDGGGTDAGGGGAV